MDWNSLLSSHAILTKILAIGFVVSELLSFLPAEVTEVSGVLQGCYLLFCKIRNHFKKS